MGVDNNSIAPVGKGRPKGDHDLKKQQIAEATWRVIAEDGVAGTTVRKIARKTGYSTGVLSHYFEDKSEILDFAVASLFSLWQSEYQKHADIEQSAEAQLRALLRSLLPTDDISKFFWKLWMQFLVEATDNPKRAQTIAETQSHMRERLRNIIRIGVADGTFAPDMDSDLMINIFNATVDGLCITFPFEQDHYQTEYINRIIERIILIIKR